MVVEATERSLICCERYFKKDGEALERHVYVGKKWCKSLFLVAKILLDFLDRQKDKQNCNYS